MKAATMKPLTKHLSTATLADYTDHRLEEAQRADAEQHLSACTKCRAALSSVQRMMAALRSNELAAAPPTAIARALQLFRTAARTQPAEPQRPSLLGLLRFDSGLTPALGMRSSSAEPTAMRQLFFSVGEFDLDIRLDSRGGQWLLAGQLLGGQAAGSAVLIGAEEQRYRSELNDLGEFRFEDVELGSYQLLIALPAVDLVIPALRVGD